MILQHICKSLLQEGEQFSSSMAIDFLDPFVYLLWILVVQEVNKKPLHGILV